MQTGGVKGAGKAVAGADEKPITVDAGTLVRRMKVTLPLVKALNVDPGLTNLLLNHLIATAAKQGRVITLPKHVQTEVVPEELFQQERRLHAQTTLDNAALVQAAIERNRKKYNRRQQGTSRVTGTRRSREGRLAHVVNCFMGALDEAIDSQRRQGGNTAAPALQASTLSS